MDNRGLRIARPDEAVAARRPRGLASRAVRDALWAACGGVREALRNAERRIRRLRKRSSRMPSPPMPEAYTRRVSREAARTLAPRVLIVAEASIPQCLKYRVVQRQEAFRRIGVECEWVSWTAASRDDLQACTHVIFYRVPAHDSILALIAEARRLRIPTWWEADDLIFDESVLRESRAIARLPLTTVRSLTEGAALYRRCLLACDAAIASTPGLADAMRRAGADDVTVVENGLDDQTLAAAEAIAADMPRRGSEHVWIVYGSGTDTHDVDFEEAAPALARVFDRHPHARLRLIGPVAVPECLGRHADRIQRLPATEYVAYLRLLAEADISIAPLEDFVFNDAKSSIKYLEASLLGLPSVCSPRAAFAAAITDGEDGLLCDDEQAWERSLSGLVADAEQRRRIGAAARANVHRRFAAARIARRQVAPLVADRRGATPRILSVNVFYQPRSFGGATIVAENVNRAMQERHGVDVHVFTTVPTGVTDPHTLYRYEADGIDVFGMGLPDGAHEGAAGFDNPEAARCFERVLDAVQPDVVHFHCVQGIGVGSLELCRDRGVPYAVTLHDAWWLCGRQFMIDRQGRYCHQQRLDADVCGSCVGDRRALAERTRRARGALAGAAVLATPSRFFADFHIANGFPQVRVNKNGITRPATATRTRRAGPLRCGYVGGNTPIKGYHLVRRVFSGLGDVAATLVIADNTMNLGFSSFGPDAIAGLPHVEVVPGYTHDTIDDFFAGIDVLLFPTQWKESFGLTVREAIARNVWVIATDAGGVVEDILPGRNGTVIPFADDGEALRGAIIDAVAMFARIPPGDPVAFDASGIRFWDEQAAELAALLRECGRRSRRMAA